MAKRSDFVRIEKDKYPTPIAAVAPLLPFLPERFSYIEPCAGDGRLISHLSTLIPGSLCTRAFDVQPDMPYKGEPISIETKDALTLQPADMVGALGRRADYIITNPPWSRDARSGFLLHRLIETFSSIAPTWLLFDHDWLANKAARPFIENQLVAVVPIGRVKWIENSTMAGKDNCSWYLFDRRARFMRGEAPRFYGRGQTPLDTSLQIAA